MAGRGPAPKPTRLKVLQGNPGHQKINKSEPKPAPVAPDRPDWLDAEGRREWDRISPVLERLGLLTEIDGAALAGYCASYSLLVKCKRVTNRGLTYKTTTGYIRPRPEVAIGAAALAEVRQFCQQFGLTPSARSRMTLPEVAEDDDSNPFDV